VLVLKKFILNKRKEKFLGRKGFIGPIGDDLPSLIPIVLSLLLFFSVFSFTLTNYDAKNSFLRQQMTLLSVARSLKGESIIVDYEAFENRCNNVREKKFPYNFMVGVYSSTADFSGVVNNFIVSGQGEISDSFLRGEKEGDYFPLFCKYRKVGSLEFSEKRKNYLLKFAPIAVQRKETIGDEEYHVIVPAVMVMVIWE
jgi:hypothetical protein